MLRTSAAVSPGLAESTSPATPATNGHADEVPPNASVYWPFGAVVVMPRMPPFEVAAGTWLVVDGEGTQSYIPDDQFTSVYEPLPAPARRGRPPKGEGDVASVPRKRRHRKRHKQQGLKAA